MLQVFVGISMENMKEKMERDNALNHRTPFPFRMMNYQGIHVECDRLKRAWDLNLEKQDLKLWVHHWVCEFGGLA